MSDTQERIREMVTSNRLMLFMKGTPESPMCGFSMRAVQVLGLLGQEFEAFNVLADAEVRQGIKEYGNWPTIPQLYIDGQLVGGSDIIIEMYQSGELQRIVSGA